MRRTPGMPIPGTERVVRAADIAAALRLKPGSAPKASGAPALSPAQVRQLEAGRLPEADADIGWEVTTIAGGRDVMDTLGVDPATLPLGVEAELGAPQPRPERRTEDTTPPPSPQPPKPAAPSQSDIRREAAKLTADFKRHSAQVIARAVVAQESGNAAKVAAATADAQAAVTLGQRLARKLGLS